MAGLSSGGGMAAPYQTPGYYGGTPSNYPTPFDYAKNNAQHGGLTPAQLTEKTPTGGSVTYGRDPAELLRLAFGATSGVGAGGYPAPPGLSMPSVEGVAEPSTNAAFERAKTAAGQNTRASIDALRNVSASSGTMGSGREARAEGAIINRGQGELSDTTRAQEESNLARSRAINDRNFGAQQARDLTQYQGGVSMYDSQLRAVQAQRQSMLELARSAFAY